MSQAGFHCCCLLTSSCVAWAAAAAAAARRFSASDFCAFSHCCQSTSQANRADAQGGQGKHCGETLEDRRRAEDTHLLHEMI